MDIKNFIGKKFLLVQKCGGSPQNSEAVFTIDGFQYIYPTILFRLVTPEDIYDKGLKPTRLSIFVDGDNIITNIGYF
jgi:hypothetical protein